MSNADLVARGRALVPHCDDPSDYTEDDRTILAMADAIEALEAEVKRLQTDLAIANRGGLDLLYAIRKSIGWTDKHSLSLLPDECARLKKSSTSPCPVTWPGKGYDHNQSGGFDGPTGAD